MLIVDQLRRGDQRLRALAIGVSAGLLILLAGLWHVQVVSARHYRARIENQTFRTVRVPAVRGKIFDRNHLVLADNRPRYDLNLYIEELRPLFEAEYRRQRNALLASVRPATNQPPRGWLSRLFARVRAPSGTLRLSAAERERLNAAVRYAVASNVVSRVAAVLQTPVQLGERDFRRHHLQWPYRPLTILENLTPQQIARFLEQAPALPGVDLEVQPIRHYPHGPLFAHVLGYLRRDDLARDDDGGFDYSLPIYEGALGIEFGFNEDLLGKPGVQSVVVNSLCYRESESIWTPAEAGKSLYLTLDVGLQQAAYNALQAAGRDVRGAVVVLDARNGDVLALVSSPAYDPNRFLAGMSEAEYQRLNDPTLRPILNRATQGMYAPGSIFKIVTALACLENGLDPDASYTVAPDPARPDKGAYFLGTRKTSRKIKDTAAPGDYDFVRAFKRSSNSYFVHHGLQAGRDRLLEMGKRFFLGERIGLPLNQEAAGFFPYPREVRWQWTDGNIANVCIGQEITVTPLQMAIMTAAVANGGRVLWPRLVLRTEPVEPSSDAATVTEFKPRVRGELGVSPQHLSLVREAMLADTEEPEGTGFLAFHERDRKTPILKRIRVGGKTGTAEVEQGGRVVDKITWFTSFGPYEDPRFVVVAMVESGGSGGGTCAPIVRDVYQAIERRLAPSPPSTPTLASQ